MKFDPFKIDLPITDVINDVREKLNTYNTLIVNAPAGAGKSTLLPLALMSEKWLSGRKIIMLEPRRLATRTIAERLAELLGEEVGDTIGYRIRFESRIGKNTQIEVVTEGILTRMLESDNSLTNVGLVIFDEFHERSIYADVALALCREAQQVLRPDLRIMIMSATLDMPQLTELLKAPSVTSVGRQYPVEIIYSGEQDRMMMPEMTARTVRDAVAKHDGDVLVFLPGQGEIRKTEGLLRQALPAFKIVPLYGLLPPAKQREAILPDRTGGRKVVLSTTIAETSLTIQGIGIVIDAGFARISKFDPNTALSRLETVPVSKDAADQRAGRAGRLGPGVCYRMWSKITQSRLNDHRSPEILESDLSNLVLDLAQWGVVDAAQLTWLTPPPKGALAQASDLLHQLDALESGRITEHGKKIQSLPCHPRIAHMLLLAADDFQALALATDLAALIEERDPLAPEAGIDITIRIEALRRSRRDRQSGRFSKIEKVAAAYRKLFNIDADNGPVDPYEAGIMLAHAYPERIASARRGNNAHFQLANGAIAMAGHKDDLANEPWLAVAHIDARGGLGKIFLAAPLNPKDLTPLVKERDVITWDTRKGGLIANRELRIGNIILRSMPLPAPDEVHRLKAINDAIKKEGETLLDFNDSVIQWQNRVLSLRRWRPEEQLPEASTAALLADNEQWLTPWLNNVKKPADLKNINLVEALQYSLSPEQQKLVERLAPSHLPVPSGSNIRLSYHPDGAAPVLAVRLQELFGLAETPRVCEGKVAVLMQLLSPGYKPVQTTSDLKSFWNGAYHEVKKEMKRRYPKHSWPDDPWNAVAVRGVVRRRVR